ncbi:zinc-binding dehydrogenase [Citrobacter koseri]|nr:zinc-binding dehydrogenase [Citrobacter koseri]
MGQQAYRNRRWVLASRPHGAPVESNFRMEEDDVATPVKGKCCYVQFSCPSIPTCAEE